MLPTGHGAGQLWIGAKFCCDVEYEISKPLKLGRQPIVQRIIVTLPGENREVLGNLKNLVLVLADGKRRRLPRPIWQSELSPLEFYIESLA